MRKKTHEEFIEEMEIKNPNIEILGKYINNSTKIEYRCKICNHKDKKRTGHLLRGSGCPKCAIKKQIKRQTKTHECFIEELKEINPNIEILGKYKGAKIHIEYRCKICNHKDEMRPDHLLRGQGCPICAGTIKKTHECFIEELKEINPNIEILGKYINNKIHIEYRCKICNHKDEMRPDHLLRGSGCPICNQSKGEKRILKYLNENNIEYIYQMKYSDLRGINDGLLSYDFYLPTYNLLIEYQGEYHDHTVSNQSDFDFAIQQEHDKRKKEYAEKNNIQLLEIWYWDFDNIEKILDTIIK